MYDCLLRPGPGSGDKDGFQVNICCGKMLGKRHLRVQVKSQLHLVEGFLGNWNVDTMVSCLIWLFASAAGIFRGSYSRGSGVAFRPVICNL